MEKVSRSEADYGRGKANEHCGPTRRWDGGDQPQHFCQFYIHRGLRVDASCKKVAGRIDSTGWCKFWEAKA